MKDDDEDLLEIYDNTPSNEYDYFQETKEDRANVFYFWMMIIFLIAIGVKFFQSLPGDGPDSDAIVLRQVQLLKIVKDTKDEQVIRAAVSEYDSLQRVLETIESN